MVEEDQFVGEESELHEEFNNVHTSSEEVEKTSHNKEYICPICGRKFSSSQALAGHMRGHKVRGEYPEEEEYKESEEEDMGRPPLPTPEEQLEQWFIRQLEEKLPMAVGDSATKIVIQTLRDDPSIIWDSRYLATHIIQLVGGRKYNKYLLQWILNSLYQKLNERIRDLSTSYPIYLPPVEMPDLSLIDAGVPMVRRDTRMPRPSERMRPSNRPTTREFEDRQYREEALRRYEHDRPPYYPPQYPYPYSQPPRTGTTDNEILKTLLEKLIDKAFEEDKPKPRKDTEPMIEVPNPYGEGTLKVPASQAPLYITLKGVQDQIKALQDALTKVGAEPKEIQPPKVKLPDGQELPADQAVYYIQVMQEKEKRALLEQRLKMMEQQVQQLYQNLNPERLVKAVEELGFQRSGSPTLDLLHKTRQDLNKMADRLLSILEIQMKRGGRPFLPQFGARRSPEERRTKLEELKEGLRRGEQLAEVENQLTQLAKELEVSTTQEQEQPKQEQQNKVAKGDIV